MNTKVNSSMLGVPLAVEIDALTNCLVHRLTGEIYETEMCRLYADEEFADHWRFNWSLHLNHGHFETHKLILKGDTEIQGLICLEIRENWVEVILAESVPWNIGSFTKEFVGVGGHLFAFACKRSFELGFEGFVAFQAKTRLIRHYQEKLHAVLLDGKGRMAIDENAAKRLVSTYFEGR
jgi:hypothetical protein